MSTHILRGDTFVADDWQTLADDAPLPAAGKFIVSLRRWRAESPILRTAKASIGVLIPNTEDMDAIHAEIADRPLLALQFPALADGRALTQASVLRGRLGYRGELRAIGDILSDLIFGLRRCGFDVIVPRADQDEATCLRALRDFSVAYQPAADGKRLIFALRRQNAA